MDLALQTIPGAHGASLDSSLLQRDAEVAVACRSGIPRVMYGLAREAGQCQAPGHRDISIPLEWCRVCQQPGSAFAPRHFSPPARGMEQSSAAGCPVVFSPLLRAVGEPDPCPQIGHSSASKAREWGGRFRVPARTPTAERASSLVPGARPFLLCHSPGT